MEGRSSTLSARARPTPKNSCFLLGGAAARGGAFGGFGTGFKLAPSGSGFTESVLYTFQGYPSDGEHPYGGLIFDSKGNLLGPTFNGGSSGCNNQRGNHPLSTVG